MKPNDKQSLAHRIAEATRNPDPEIAKRVRLAGDDGRWYSPSGGLPNDVAPTGERKEYYVVQYGDGVTGGTTFDSPEALLADWKAEQDALVAAFEKDLLAMPELEFNVQRRYWLKEL